MLHLSVCGDSLTMRERRHGLLIILGGEPGHPNMQTIKGTLTHPNGNRIWVFESSASQFLVELGVPGVTRGSAAADELNRGVSRPG